MKNIIKSFEFIDNNLYINGIQYDKEFEKNYFLDKSFFENSILKDLEENNYYSKIFLPIEIKEKNVSIITYKYIENDFSNIFFTKYKKKLVYYFISEKDYSLILAKYKELEEKISFTDYEDIFNLSKNTDYEINEKSDNDEYLDINDTLNAESPIIIKGISAIIRQALEQKASDIHLEPQKEKFVIRYRIDGILIRVREISLKLQQGFLSRLKIMASLDITERRLPQDGRFRLKSYNEEIDFRISIIPTIHGEKAVIRILNNNFTDMNLENLGLDEKNYLLVSKEIKKTKGIILVTGPTGSGKSSTLYAIIKKINNGNINICTVEDPVETQITGVNQVQCHYDIGRDFKIVLRAFLRQDPDVMMVGEIRDYPTAEIAIKAAMTGHLVFSTLHTNDAISGIFRLINLGIEPYMISATVNLIISQRLIRKLCNNCKIIDENYQEKLSILGIKEDFFERKFYTEKGCKLCNHTGYKGRVAIFEIFYLDEEIKEAIDKRENLLNLSKISQGKNMVSLLEDALGKAKIGITSLDEIIRQY